MKNRIFLISVITMGFILCSYENEKKAIVNLCNFDYNKIVNIYNLPNKEKIIARIKDDTIKENYHGFTILEKRDSMLKVLVWSSKSKKEYKGWINVSNTGVYIRQLNSVMYIYEKPNYKSVRIKINVQGSYMVKVIDIYDNWLKVELMYKKKIYRYWLPPEYQCPDIYNSCT